MSQGSNRQESEVLRELSSRVSSAKHDINNPLSIISGNAQLLAELARAMDLGDEFLEPIRDIQDASERISNSLEELDALHTVLPDEGSPQDQEEM